MRANVTQPPVEPLPFPGETGAHFGRMHYYADHGTAAEFELARTSRSAPCGRFDRTGRASDWTAAVSHELMQPVASIALSGEACLNWLRADAPVLHEVRANVDMIVREARRLAEIVRQLRSLFLDEPLQKVRVDLNGEISSALAAIEPERRHGAIRVETDLDPAGAWVEVDTVLLRQVMLNLLRNAFHAMDGTSVEREMSIMTRCRDAGALHISFADNGGGFDAADPDQLFEPFFTTKADGTGIVLSLCRRIIEMHGGSIRAVRNDEAGATFHIILPSSQAPGERRHAPSSVVDVC
ncbi:signal transduction histidine kinase [Ancylobacter sp. 3268]|uniref:sensor histidine kinase n=1 Tax=Ancylobacter sp. 3268 TaxID=2817752 RepID=UPI002866262E|nr:HAMP domain-containing sensor histidine kinase [Ancylobacter sp. 3268]MDR6955538.1 signal transduction histidine kinase [Ancylobacter sp. 3268]